MVAVPRPFKDQAATFKKIQVAQELVMINPWNISTASLVRWCVWGKQSKAFHSRQSAPHMLIQKGRCSAAGSKNES